MASFDIKTSQAGIRKCPAILLWRLQSIFYNKIMGSLDIDTLHIAMFEHAITNSVQFIKPQKKGFTPSGP